MIKLEEYSDINKLNHALLLLSEQGIKIHKVKLLTVKDEVKYYILYENETNDYQSR